MNNLEQTFEYQLLGRLQQDCDYYLGAGARNKRHLWALDEVLQIKKMKEIYENLPIKPEWLSMGAINEYERKMTQNDPKEMTKTPIQSLPAPPHLNYRVERTAINSAKLSPPVGKRFSLQESTSLKEWVLAAGFRAWLKGHSVYVVGDDAPDIPDGLFEQRAAKANAKAIAKQESAEVIASSRTSEYRGLPSSHWIEVEMGADFANPFNKLMLARFLDCRDEFKGLLGNGWIAPLTALGLDTQSEGLSNSDVLAFLKESYDKFKEAQLSEQQHQPKESQPTIRM